MKHPMTHGVFSGILIGWLLGWIILGNILWPLYAFQMMGHEISDIRNGFQQKIEKLK